MEFTHEAYRRRQVVVEFVTGNERFRKPLRIGDETAKNL